MRDIAWMRPEACQEQERARMHSEVRRVQDTARMRQEAWREQEIERRHPEADKVQDL